MDLIEKLHPEGTDILLGSGSDAYSGDREVKPEDENSH
jgi:hypothetical protein